MYSPKLGSLEKDQDPPWIPCGSPHGSPCLDHCTAPTSTRLDASSEDAAAVRSSSPPARLPLPHVGCYIHTALLCFHSKTIIQAEKVPTTRARKKAGYAHLQSHSGCLSSLEENCSRTLLARSRWGGWAMLGEGLSCALPSQIEATLPDSLTQTVR